MNQIDQNQIIFEETFKPENTYKLSTKDIIEISKNLIIDLSKYTKLNEIDHFVFNDDENIQFINYPSNLKTLHIYGRKKLDISTLNQNLEEIRISVSIVIAKYLLADYSLYMDNDLMNLPTNLKKLLCNHQKITCLNNLPHGLIELDCRNNRIVQLDYLPETLVKLNCSQNKLTSLDNLPKRLEYLDCSYNQIVSLDNLPTHLIELIANTNQINTINNLPPNIAEINLLSNPLVKIPQNIKISVLLNCSLDKKASWYDKVILLFIKFKYNIYYFIKYFGITLYYTMLMPFMIVKKTLQKYGII